MILTPTELELLTRKKHRDAQMRVLVHLGIPFDLRPDGTLVVSSSAVEHLLGGEHRTKLRKPVEPNWDALAEAT